MPKVSKVKSKASKTKKKTLTKTKPKVNAKSKEVSKGPIKISKLIFLKILKNICVKNTKFFLE